MELHDEWTMIHRNRIHPPNLRPFIQTRGQFVCELIQSTSRSEFSKNTATTPPTRPNRKLLWINNFVFASHKSFCGMRCPFSFSLVRQILMTKKSVFIHSWLARFGTLTDDAPQIPRVRYFTNGRTPTLSRIATGIAWCENWWIYGHNQVILAIWVIWDNSTHYTRIWDAISVKYVYFNQQWAHV